MKSRLHALTLMAGAAVFVFLADTVVAQQPVGLIPDNYIVVLRDDVNRPQNVADEHAQQHAAVVSQVYEVALKGYAARIPPARLSALQRDPRVLFVSQDHEVQMSDQTLPSGVNRVEADKGLT